MKFQLLAIFSFVVISASAQSEFYLQPEIGDGMAYASVHIPEMGWPVYSTGPAKGIANYSGQLGIGYQYNNWSLSSGIGFMKTGYSWQYLSGDFITVFMTETRIDYDFILPLMVSYRFNIGKHFFISPSAGGAVSWNYSEQQLQYQSFDRNKIGNQVENRTIKGSEFYKTDVPISLWADVKAMAGYKINNRMSIIAGPEARYMLGSIVKNNSLSQKNYSYTFNAGITWQLKNPYKTEKHREDGAGKRLN